MSVQVVTVGGTAPRVRGARMPSRRGRAGPGNSPAGAGSTDAVPAGSCWTREQPRGCGEHWSSCTGGPRGKGTAPRVRGAHTHSLTCDDPSGNSPAGAGSTGTRAPRTSPRREQPRGCGEHNFSIRRSVRPGGTAPRVRGAPVGAVLQPVGLGNSPAGAGSTCAAAIPGRPRREQPRGCGEHSSPRGRRRAGREQPRGCGEHAPFRAVEVLSEGTAPRVRGAPVPSTDERPRSGNSPAGAGSTSEHARLHAGNWGTAPRVRGAPACGGSSAPRPGEQPRGCGEHRRLFCWSSRTREQPRGCGEHAYRDAWSQAVEGTAPRVRGAQLLTRHARTASSGFLLTTRDSDISPPSRVVTQAGDDAQVRASAYAGEREVTAGPGPGGSPPSRSR